MTGPDFGGRLLLPAAEYKRDRGLWLTARRSGLGASDTAAVLGLNSYRSALDVWLDKTATGPAEDAAGPAAQMGHDLEAWAARLTAKRYPALGKLVPTPGLLVHPEHSWMLATVDYGLADRGSRTAPVRELLEVKTTSVANYRRNWVDGVPPSGILVQCQQQLAVTGLSVVWVTCFVGGMDGPGTLVEPYRVERSPAVIDQLIGYAGSWWRDFVEAGRRPDPVMADADKLGWLWPADDAAGALPLTADLEATIADLIHARRRVKDAEADEAAAAFKLKAAMAEHTAIADPAGDVLVTWKESVTRRWDTKRLAADRPDLAEEYRPAKTGRGSLLVKNYEERI
jgi:putative phage-type endonuclease